MLVAQRMMKDLLVKQRSQTPPLTVAVTKPSQTLTWGGGKKGKEAILVKLGIICVRTVLLFRNLGDWSLNLPDSYRKGVLALNEEVCCILWALLLAHAQIPSRAYFSLFKYRNLLKISFNDIFTFKKNVWIFKMLFISEVVHCLVDFSLSLL